MLGMYSHTEKYMLVCIIRKKQVGEMMKIIKNIQALLQVFPKSTRFLEDLSPKY